MLRVGESIGEATAMTSGDRPGGLWVGEQWANVCPGNWRDHKERGEKQAGIVEPFRTATNHLETQRGDVPKLGVAGSSPVARSS